MTKIKAWFKALFLKWGDGIARETHNEEIMKLRAEIDEATETINKAKDAVTWLRTDNEKLIEEQKVINNPITITAEIDLNTSPAWKDYDEAEAVVKLKQYIIRKFGEACYDYMSVFKSNDNYLTCTVNVIKYDR